MVIGDKDSDIELGRRVGATTILVSAGVVASAADPASADYTVPDLIEAARIIDPLSDAAPAGAAAQRGA